MDDLQTNTDDRILQYLRETSAKLDYIISLCRQTQGPDCGSAELGGIATAKSFCPEPGAQPLWEDYARRWYETFERPRLRVKTQAKCDNLMRKHVIPALAGRRIDEITADDVQAALNARRAYSRAYLRDILSLLSQALDAACEDGMIPRNPAKSHKVYNPSAKVSERRPLTPEEKADIIAHIPDLREANDRMFMALLMYTGLRPSEIYGLRWEDMDAEGGFIHIRRAVTFSNGRGIVGATKTARGVRTVPFERKMLELFDEIRAEGYVLCRQDTPWRSEADEPYSEQTHHHAWKRIQRQMDLHGMTPYIARHTYATELHRNGVPMKTAMTIMGHGDERMLMRVYVHDDESDLRRAGRIMHEYYDRITSAERPAP